MDRNLLPAVGVGALTTGLGVVVASGGLNATDSDSSVLSDLMLVSELLGDEKIFPPVLSNLPSGNLEHSRDITNKYSEFPCTKYLFGDSKWNNPDKLTSGLRIKTSDQDLVLNEEGRVTGCLNVWWEKEFFNNKWKGKFNLVWAINDGKHGVILTSIAVAGNNKVTFYGDGFTLEKKGKEWETVGFQSTAGLSLTSENKEQLDKVMIKSGGAIEGEKVDSQWGFDITWGNICETDEICISDNRSKYSSSNRSWVFEKDKEKGKPLKRWSSNMDKWSANEEGTLFSTNHSDMYKKIKGIFRLVAQQSKKPNG